DLSAAMRAKMGDVPEAELTQLKNTQGLIRGVGDSTVYDVLSKSMAAIVEEIGMRIQYWNTKDTSHAVRQIESIILWGGSINMKGLPAYFTETLGVEARRADVWQNAFSIEKHVPPIGRRYS